MSGLGKLSTVKRFASKQNDVTLVRWGDPPRLCVAKRFVDRARLEKELRISERIRESGLRAPAVLGRSEDTVLYEYVEGRTLCALLDEAEASGDGSGVLFALGLLCEWLGAFHAATGAAFYDINLRNFVLHGGAVYGFDYEDAREGAMEEDYGRLLAFVLTYDSAFTGLKLGLGRRLLPGMCGGGAEKGGVLDAMKRELTAMLTRRAVKYPLTPDAAAAAIEEGNGL